MRLVSVSIDVLDYANETRLGKVTVTIQAVAATEGPWVLPARCSQLSVVATICPKDEVVADEKKEGSIMRGRQKKRSTTTADFARQNATFTQLDCDRHRPVSHIQWHL